jgi:PAS domain-containing protein
VTQLIMRLERLAETEATLAQMLHVVDLGADGRAPAASTPLSHWLTTVNTAQDPCLLLDAAGRVLAVSTTAAGLLGCSEGGVIGRHLLDVVDVVDFDSGTSSPDYAVRIAPVAVLANGGGLMRSLFRVRRRDGEQATVDAAAAPLHDDRGRVVGSMTFLAPVRA